MENCLIFWHFAGREHGGLNYTTDIRNNSSDVISKCKSIKEEFAKDIKKPNRFIKYDSNTLIELSPEESENKFIFVYFMDLGIQLEFNETKNWLVMIDIVEVKEIKESVFCVTDLFLDIEVQVDGSYKVLDIDEFEEAISLGVLDKEQISWSLKALHIAIDKLNNKELVDNRLVKIQRQFETFPISNLTISSLV
jgi:ribosome biogenesis SPOUT family RNA methylase Rps3